MGATFNEVAREILRLSGKISKKIIRTPISFFVIVVAKLYSDKYPRWVFRRACGEFMLRRVGHRGKNFRIKGFVQIVDEDKLTIGDGAVIGIGIVVLNDVATWRCGSWWTSKNSKIQKYGQVQAA